MKIAIMSDIHDNVWNLAKALDAIKGNADAVICCGDLCSPFIINLFAQGLFELPVHIVFGNNDGDLYRITKNANRYTHLYGETAELVEMDGELIERREFEEKHGHFFDSEQGGKRIAVNHYHNIALGLAASGVYDVVCYGHNHHFRIQTVGETLTINPGAIMGYDPAVPSDIPATYVIYDTEIGEAQGYQILQPDDQEFGHRRVALYTGD